MLKARGVFRLSAAVLSLGVAAIAGIFVQSWIVKRIQSFGLLSEGQKLDSTFSTDVASTWNRPLSSSHEPIDSMSSMLLPETQQEISTTFMHLQKPLKSTLSSLVVPKKLAMECMSFGGQDAEGEYFGRVCCGRSCEHSCNVSMCNQISSWCCPEHIIKNGVQCSVGQRNVPCILESSTNSVARRAPAHHLAQKPRQKCRICQHINVNKLAREVNTLVTSLSSKYMILTVGNARLFRPGGDLHSIWCTWGCYGNRFAVAIRALDPDHIPECRSFSNEWFFRRVCTIRVVIQVLQEEDGFGGFVGTRELDLVEQPKWVLTLDGDCIVHSHVPLADIFNAAISQDIVVYERFFNGEIHAGNMGLRLTPWVVTFLRGWQEYHTLNYFNADNGVLHIHLLRALRQDSALSHSKEVEKQLQSRLASVKNIAVYDKFIAWVKLLLGPKRIFKHVLVMRRGMAFCIDAYVAKFFYSHGELSGKFLCLHGVKNRQSVLKKYGPTCVELSEKCGSSLHDCAQKNTLSNAGLTEVMRKFRSDRQGLGGMNDVSECWPDCPTEISGAVWRSLEIGLKSNR